jgi:alpha-galactosidase
MLASTLCTAVCLAFLGGNPSERTADAAIATLDTVVRVRADDAGLRVLSIGHPQQTSTSAAAVRRRGRKASVPVKPADPSLSVAGWTAECLPTTSIPLISMIESDGKRVPVRWRFREKIEDPGRCETIFLFVCDRPALELKSIWRAFPGPGPVEHEITIANRGKETILLPLQTTLAFSLQNPSGHALEQWWVDRGKKRASPIGTHQDAIAAGFRSSLVSQPHDGPIPWFSVQDITARRGWYAGIEFSGCVRMTLQADADKDQNITSLKTILGLGKTDAEEASYRTRVHAGETFAAPTVFVGCYNGDVDDGANRLRRWVEKHIWPSSPWNLPLLVNNTWGNQGKIDDAILRRMIDLAAQTGMELFHVDALWFRHVGDWRSDPVKFPHGIEAISDYARAKGLPFGLWVAWNQGGDRPDPSGRHAFLSAKDPTMKNWFHCDVHENWKNSDWSGVPVCLGDPRAVEWCIRETERVVRDFKLDQLEYDQRQIVDECIRGDHRHTSSPIDISYHAALGHYKVQDTLRAKFPNLIFEDCDSGGHLVDYGTLRRSHYISIIDNYDPISNRKAFYDASYALPASACECYVKNLPGKDLATFRYMLRSGMMGWCSVMIDMSWWSAEQLAEAARQYDVYKNKLRPLIRHGNLYHVSDRPDGVRWDGLQYFDPANGRGVLYAFRGTTPEAKHVFRLKGLDPKARYQVVFEDGSSPTAVMTGEELLGKGVTVSLSETENSELVFFNRL